MDRTEKERVVAELVERLRETDSLIVADYRGLTNAQLVELRAKLRGSGARLSVVKNTLTRRAAEEAGTEALLALLEGPTAIAFVEAEGDPVAVAKALADASKDTKVLALRGGLLSGQTLSGAEVEELAKLPAPEIVKSQLVGVIVAPLTQLAANVPHSGKMRIVERFRLTEPDTMTIETTITDPDVLREPYTSTRALRRHRTWTIAEYICEENNRNFVDDSGKAGVILDNPGGIPQK